MESQTGSLESLELNVVNLNFWSNRRVLVTGHTGFKGSWLLLLLSRLGAKLYGFSLAPPTQPNLYQCAGVRGLITEEIGDVCDYAKLQRFVDQVQPQVIFHLAAQSLVRKSYEQPLRTYSTNVLGVANILESVRHCSAVKAILVVTSDKCYENRESSLGYVEGDALGGDDPYSSSKACAELVVSAYRKSFWQLPSASGIATARAGNVIGGGDWGPDRLVPDCFSAWASGRELVLRNPYSIRPWQHVLDALYGYLMLAANLFEKPLEFSQAWNFGPGNKDCITVQELVRSLRDQWGSGDVKLDAASHPPETGCLQLNSAKARSLLGWQPGWSLDVALARVVEWFRAYQEKANMQSVCFQQINDYLQRCEA